MFYFFDSYCKDGVCHSTIKGDYTNHNSEYSSDKVHPFTYFTIGLFIFLFIMVIILLITYIIKRLDK